MGEQKEEKRKDKRLTGLFEYIRHLFGRTASILPQEEVPEEELEYPRENPYIHRMRMILNQVLMRYGISYREFCPLLIDTDMPPESLLDEDQVEIMLEQISQDLNFLRIATDRPAYFAEYIQRMYEDSGLVVQVCSKEQHVWADVNMVLDMEQKGECPLKYLPEHMIYIPLYKRKWSHADNTESGTGTPKTAANMRNLDISIPIGYNTVIVKGE